MKRFYNYFLSLFLLSIAGITSAVAQGFSQGDLLTSMDDIVGKQVLIFANGGITSDAPSGFLNGSKALTETASTKECLFTFEATGKTTTNGNHPTYRLKQLATGLYLKLSKTSMKLRSSLLALNSLQLLQANTIVLSWAT